MDKKLFVVTNRKLVNGRNLIDVINGAVKGGADAVILREKDLSTDELYRLALKLKQKINNKIPLIINGNLEVAEYIGASGVHFSYEQFINRKKKFAGINGVSIHSLEEAENVQNIGADYILAGHIFSTACKKGLEGRGTDYLKKLCDNLRIPVIAIGGINLGNINNVLEAGVDGIAIMSSVMEAEKSEEVVYKMKEKLCKL
jgi:thiamine-phosphate pyrophosphorylase